MCSSHLINEFVVIIQTEMNFLWILLPFQRVSFVWPLFPNVNKVNVSHGLHNWMSLKTRDTMILVKSGEK